MMTIYLRTEILDTHPEREISIPTETVEFQPFNNCVEFYHPEEEWSEIVYDPATTNFIYKGLQYGYCFIREGKQ